MPAVGVLRWRARRARLRARQRCQRLSGRVLLPRRQRADRAELPVEPRAAGLQEQQRRPVECRRSVYGLLRRQSGCGRTNDNNDAATLRLRDDDGAEQ